MQRPNLHDEMLGLLEWNEALNRYEAAIYFTPSHLVRVNIELDDEEPDPAIERARAAYTHIQERELDLRRAATDALLDNYNLMLRRG